MNTNKKSWDYQKDRYIQFNLKFNMGDVDDALLCHFLKSFDNQSHYVKQLIKDDMFRRAWNNE